MPFLIDDLLIGLAVTAAGAGISAALAPNVPGVTLDGGEGTRAEAETLPAQRQLAAAMQQGTRVSIPTGRTITKPVTEQWISLTGRTGQGAELVPYVESGTYVVGLDTFAANVTDQYDVRVYVDLADGVSAEDGRATLTSALQQWPNATLQAQIGLSGTPDAAYTRDAPRPFETRALGSGRVAGAIQSAP